MVQWDKGQALLQAALTALTNAAHRILCHGKNGSWIIVLH
jgi:hypothetical protein